MINAEAQRRGGKLINQRTYNPKKGCKDLTQRRKGVEKARKENHFKSENSHPLRLSWFLLASLRWAFDFSPYCFGVKTYSLCLGYRSVFIFGDVVYGKSL
jgi:hypothetical protein